MLKTTLVFVLKYARMTRGDYNRADSVYRTQLNVDHNGLTTPLTCVSLPAQRLLTCMETLPQGYVCQFVPMAPLLMT